MSLSIQEPPPATACEELITELETLRQAIEQAAVSGREAILRLPPERRQSAENLLRYLAMRNQDLQPLQDRLASLGLSSLGHSEAHVLATLNAVLRNLYLLSGDEPPAHCMPDESSAADAEVDYLEQNTISLLGQGPEQRRARIMVTMSSDAADDYLMVHDLVNSGMDCLRINCAHDATATWSRTIEHLRDAERATGHTCRILMDLCGPKLRTGPMESEPAVVKIRPLRDARGEIVRPARIWLTSEKAPWREMDAADANIALEPSWLARLDVGDRVRLKDVRGSRRNWRIRKVTTDGCWAEANKTTYISNGTILNRRGDPRKTTIKSLPPQESVIHLRTGDVVLMSGAEEHGKPALHDDNGELLSPGRVVLPIPEVYRDAHPGETVCFDDGRIAGIIEKVSGQQLQIRITHTRKPVERLTRDKGVNLPDTQLGLPALSEKDLQDLEFVADHADMIGLSFANSPEDVRDLREHLLELGCEDIGVILKIETKRGFANLPAMLFEAQKFPACGVMIARGDLGVECGFERMAELQEEIMWVCEAAHVPVVWATQVLENLTKRGHASRAEITDAAMSQSAECVMLNKGPYITEAVQMLDDILQRMQRHHSKKRPLLGKLHLTLNIT
jgi:pyruvate kinase